MDVNGYGTIFLDQIRERNLFGLVFDNEDGDAYYCPELVIQFYTQIDTNTIDHYHQTFIVHFESRDIVVNINTLEIITHVPCPPRHDALFSLIEYMTVMRVRCEEKDCGLKASTIFRNVHCVGRWVQRNIIGLNHIMTFNRPVLQTIHSLMTRQHTVCLNTIIWQHILANFQHTRGAKYSHSILVTHICRHFLPDEVFSAYDWVHISIERLTSAYSSYLHAVWSPTGMTKDVPAEFSSEEQSEEEDESAFWQQPPRSDTKAFISSIWKAMKKIFTRQAKLRKRVEEQNKRLERIEEGS